MVRSAPLAPPSRDEQMTGVAELLTIADVRAVAARALAAARGGYLADHDLRHELEAIDRDGRLSSDGRAAFQDLLARVGVPTIHHIDLPTDIEPFWLRRGHPLANHRSHETLPGSADVVVIGAGLTGASAAYHLCDAARSGLRIVTVDQGDPASEASGRNGGNFELIPENSVGVYEGLASERIAFLRRCYPGLPIEVIQPESERQASLVLGLSLRNRDLLKRIILDERIDCDFTPRGWLHLASSEEEEQGMCDEVTLAAEHGQRIELWSRRKIRQETGFENPFLGRFIPGDGTYHPFKYACGLLQAALRSGVELYTHVRVCDVVSDSSDRHHVRTDRGTIVARAVIVATNAFTSRLFPELAAIRPHQCQVQVTEHAPDRARGRVVTCENGPTFFNQPREGARGGRAPLILGGGPDRVMTSPSSRRRSRAVHAQLLAQRDRFFPELRGVPPSAEWVGPMGFTPDQLPVIGYLRPGVVVAAGYNGYGGSYTTAAGQASARMALTGEIPEWVPEDVFSPRRLVTQRPLFMSERDGLWRIAASLCRQLASVNRQISEALTLRIDEVSSAVPNQEPPRVSRMVRIETIESTPGSTIDPELLHGFPAFKHFTIAELEILLQSMRRWDLSRGTVVFTEGEMASTCFVLVRGLVDVSVKVRGQPQLLAQLTPGSIFGQASLIDAVSRSESCSVRRDAILAEIDADSCERLLSDRSGIALKLLAALNQGLVSALRSADRRLMRLDGEQSGEWAAQDLRLLP